MKLLIRAAWCVAITLPAVASAQTAENVAVIINDASADSRRVGEYYVQQRAIPPSNVIRIQTGVEEMIDRDAYVSTIEGPIARALEKESLQDRVLYLVLTKGVPLRIAGTMGTDGTAASVDSELTLLYRRMLGQTVLTRGHTANPYYLGTRDIREAAAFTHRDHDIYLVSRLDGFSADAAIALIDRGKAPTTTGRIVLDQGAGPTSRLGDEWLAEAADRLSVGDQGDRVLLESTAAHARDIDPVLGYYSWGSAGAQAGVRSTGLGFAPGALAASFVSSDARTFREPPANWLPASGRVVPRTAVFAGSAHPLIGDLISEGVTGVAGHVAEPYLQSVVRPEVLFPAYLAGRNLIESYYLALPHLSWQSVIVGDPLCAPFAGKPADSSPVAAPLDPRTELPAHFSARRIQYATTLEPGMPENAAALWVHSGVLLGRQDLDAAQKAMEQSIAIAPRFVGPRWELGMLYDTRGNADGAIGQYERILELQPHHVGSLNNLAFAIAVHRKAPAEALSYARRAVTIAPTEGPILDTLAWIEHLLGDDATAAKRLSEAIRRSPESADIRLHAAIVHAALGARAPAEAHLKEALRLKPALAETDQVEQLKARLLELSP